MERRGHGLRIALVVLCVLAISPLVVCVGLNVYQMFTTRSFSHQPALAAIDAAQRRWADSQTEHYQISVRMSGSGEEHWTDMCSYRAEVRGERLVGAGSSSCNFAPMTVSELFGWLRTNIQTFEGRCGPNGCACDGPIGLVAAYDPQRGYPLRASYRPQPQYAWLYQDKPWYAHLLGTRRACTMAAMRSMRIDSVAVTPLAP